MLGNEEIKSVCLFSGGLDKNAIVFYKDTEQASLP